jgi:hypothetical protein
MLFLCELSRQTQNELEFIILHHVMGSVLFADMPNSDDLQFLACGLLI